MLKFNLVAVWTLVVLCLYVSADNQHNGAHRHGRRAIPLNSQSAGARARRDVAVGRSSGAGSSVDGRGGAPSHQLGSRRSAPVDVKPRHFPMMGGLSGFGGGGSMSDVSSMMSGIGSGVSGIGSGMNAIMPLLGAMGGTSSATAGAATTPTATTGTTPAATGSTPASPATNTIQAANTTVAAGAKGGIAATPAGGAAATSPDPAGTTSPDPAGTTSPDPAGTTSPDPAGTNAATTKKKRDEAGGHDVERRLVVGLPGGPMAGIGLDGHPFATAGYGGPSAGIGLGGTPYAGKGYGSPLVTPETIRQHRQQEEAAGIVRPSRSTLVKTATNGNAAVPAVPVAAGTSASAGTLGTAPVVAGTTTTTGTSAPAVAPAAAGTT
ncbi:hypothetical protein ACQY0O_004671 [Thecaphora frezii]